MGDFEEGIHQGFLRDENYALVTTLGPSIERTINVGGDIEIPADQGVDPALTTAVLEVAGGRLALLRGYVTFNGANADGLLFELPEELCPALGFDMLITAQDGAVLKSGYLYVGNFADDAGAVFVQFADGTAFSATDAVTFSGVWTLPEAI